MGFPGKLTHLKTGFNHTVYVVDAKRVFCSGFNHFGQCGASPNAHDMFEYYHEVETVLDKDETIIDVTTGQNHNVLLTSKGKLYFWGSTAMNQYPGFIKEYGSSILFSGMIEMDIGLREGEKPVRVKGAYNRTVVFTNQDRVLIIGGEDTSFYYGLPKINQMDISKEFEGKKIKDVALGLWHTLVVTED